MTPQVVRQIVRKLDAFLNVTAQVAATRVPLIRVTVGKVEDIRKLDRIIQATEELIPQSPSQRTQAPSVEWVKIILRMLEDDQSHAEPAIGTSVLAWERVRAFTMEHSHQVAAQPKNRVPNIADTATFSLLDL